MKVVIFPFLLALSSWSHADVVVAPATAPVAVIQSSGIPPEKMGVGTCYSDNQCTQPRVNSIPYVTCTSDKRSNSWKGDSFSECIAF